MSLADRYQWAPVSLEITDILRTDERVIRVVLKATGRPADLRRDLIEVYPGRITAPRWLAEKILTTSHIQDDRQ